MATPCRSDSLGFEHGNAGCVPEDARARQDVLTWPEPSRDALLRSLVGRSGTEPLAQLIAIADTDKVARLRLLRSLRDLEEG